MKNKLLYFNLAIDDNDTSLGFAIKWIETIAQNYYQVDVVTLRKSSDVNFSQNINIYSANESKKRISKYVHLFKIVKQLTSENQYDRCFSHMSPISVVIASYYLKKYNIKTTLWFTHPGPKFGIKKIILYISLLLSEYIVTASRSSFPFKSKKVNVIGHAIDLERFKNNKKVFKLNKFVILSRISSSKDLELSIDSFLKSNFSEQTLDIIGGPLNESDEKYLKELTKKYDHPNINFLGKIKYIDLPKKLEEYDVHINSAKSGFFDKSVLETLSVEILNLYKNSDFNILFDGNELFNFNNSIELINKLNNLSSLSEDNLQIIFNNLQTKLEQNSISTLNKRLKNYL